MVADLIQSTLPLSLACVLAYITPLPAFAVCVCVGDME